MKTVLIVTALTGCFGAIFGFHVFDQERAPILGRGAVMLLNAIVFGLGGVVIGLVIAAFQGPPSDQTG
jgi:hypothetical protein